MIVCEYGIEFSQGSKFVVRKYGTKHFFYLCFSILHGLIERFFCTCFLKHLLFGRCTGYQSVFLFQSICDTLASSLFKPIIDFLSLFIYAQGNDVNVFSLDVVMLKHDVGL